MRSNPSGSLSKAVFLLAIVGMACGWVMPIFACPCSSKKKPVPKHKVIAKKAVASCQACSEAQACCCCANPGLATESEQIQEIKCQCMMLPITIPSNTPALANPGSQLEGKASQVSNTVLSSALAVVMAPPGNLNSTSWHDSGIRIPIRFCRLTI